MMKELFWANISSFQKLLLHVTVDHNVLINKLEHNGIRGTAQIDCQTIDCQKPNALCILTFLNNRKQFVVLEDNS